MPCGGCDHDGEGSVSNALRPRNKSKKIDLGAVVGKSKNPDVKVALQYYGGGIVKKTWQAGCGSCGKGGAMSLLTSETIMFASDDAPYGMFKQLFQQGRTYHVTEKQAEYLLSLTFINQAGQEVNKFKKIEL